MKKILFLSVLILSLFTENKAVTYYVSKDGNDSNNGLSSSTAFLNLSKAVTIVVAGDTIFVRGGTYTLTSKISITRSGSSDKYISILPYTGDEQPLLDFSTQTFGTRGIELKGSYWYIKGLRIKGSGDNGMYIGGKYNKIEFCTFFENRDSGMQLSGGAAYNQIINCDSYANADPTDYGDADGFAVKMDIGTGNYFYGCRSWLNCDDGWDGYLRGTNDVTTTLENCWTSRNGYFKNGTDAGAKANGNGFKMGGSDAANLKHNFILKNCLAFCNKAKSFDQNNNKGNITLYNCSAYGGTTNYGIPANAASGKTILIVNCVSLSGPQSLVSSITQQTNSWNSPFTTTVDDFLSIDTAQTYLPRKADGSLPDIMFMKLAEGSDLINAGTDVGLSFKGTLPDLGFAESDYILKINAINDLNLVIYPTRTKDKLYIRNLPTLINNSDISVYGINGVKQTNLKIDNQKENIELNVQSLDSGIYILRIKSGTKNYCGKFVKTI